MATRGFQDAEIKLLWARSAGLCVYPGCRQQCVQPGSAADPATPIGAMAHIAAHSNKGPRADPSMTAQDRRRYANLILLCPTHHNIVDKQENTFTIANLRDWKTSHETWVAGRLSSSLLAVGFKELEEVCQHLLAAAGVVTNDLKLVAPADKIQRNSLGPSTARHINMGLSRATEVTGFLEMKEKVDSGYADRLAARFTTKYLEQKADGLSPDAVFQALWDFACPGGAPNVAAAGLVVLTYLFERCEVFEK